MSHSYINLLWYGSRWYDDALGRFIQPDLIIPDPYNPLAYDRYQYVYSNPVKYIDPDGRCPSPPPGWGPAICVALFIAPPEVRSGPLRLHGDNRVFGASSNPAASRGYIWISPDGAKYNSHMNPSAYVFDVTLIGIDSYYWVDPSDNNTWTVTTSEDGAITVEYDLVVSGILDSSGVAPHINGTITFWVSEDGSFGYEFDRDGFPWAEAYYYDGQGGVQTIFQDPAVRGNPYDLFAIEPNSGHLARLTRVIQGFGLGRPLTSRQDNFCRPGEPC